ncbi:COG3650 family protein [Erythrobacter sp. NE805]|uniref:COG3650 family protein n=1 Tax=Erythrobacter sp. NE805 TaxID=3389875 RepID=UPI00396B28E9
MTRSPAIPLLLLLAACAPAKQHDGIDPEARAFDKVAPSETVTMLGTEPFWNLRIEGGEGTWSTPDNQPGTRLALTRFAGNNGLGFSGTLGGKPFTATLTPGTCSDGMSDRRFPFVATIALGGETFAGCGYTTSQPFSGDEAP